MSNTNRNAQCSEVARLLDQIGREYEAATRGLSGIALTAQHSFITARMENMGKLGDELGKLTGGDPIAFIVQVIDEHERREASPPQ